MKPELLAALAAALMFATAVPAQTVPAYVPTNGLVGWWPFSGNAQDQSGNGNHGVVSGATLDSDRFGNSNQAYYFNGTNNVISVAPPNASFANGVTVSLWCKLVQGSGNAQFLVTRGNDNTVGHFHMQYNQQAFPQKFGGGINQWFNTPSVLSSQTYPTPHNEWYHVVYTYDNQTEYLYINCQLAGVTEYSGQIGNNPDPIQFGNGFSTHNDTYRVRGLVDDIGIWNRALNREEIKALYYAGNPPPATVVMQTACNSYTWPLNGQTYTESGSYSETLTNSTCCCDSTVMLELTILSNFVDTVIAQINSGQTYTLPDGKSVNAGGVYAVNLPGIDGCDSLITTILSVLEIDYKVFIPNGFSPNDDGINDTWQVFGNKEFMERLEVQVFDRWGEKVFESSDIDFRWNGRFKGKPVSAEEFVYIVKITWAGASAPKVYTGSITILR